MTLEKYQQKRKFKETLEPKGESSKTGKNRFVVQEHQASHHHFDFRLEMMDRDGYVLKSWAIPKEIPQKSKEKRLAVATEDHPVEYLDFEGKIPQGQYGAGTVKIWDKGQYKLLDKSNDKISFVLKGEKLKGEYALIKFKEPKNWLLIKASAK